MSALAWLSEPVVPLAWCWRIERADGAVLGLTTHDRDLMLGGLIYRSAPGIRPSAIVQARGLSGDSLDIEGALTAEAIAASDLAQGRWDGARLTLAVADWQAADARHLVIAEGNLGAVSSDGVGFTAELGSLDVRLDAPAVPETSAECRAELGDALCRVAMAGRVWRSSVTALAGREVTLARGWAGGIFAFGRLRWIDGPLRGLSSAIAAHDGDRLVLVERPDTGGATLTGLTVELREGCDKRAATCSGRFANIANFRAEPHLPGIDLLTRFPGG